MTDDFIGVWTNWATAARAAVGLPGGNVEDLAATLMVLHAGLQSGTLPTAYSGPLVNAAIRSWRPPARQRKISRAALEFLQNGGEARRLVIEHNPPIAFYRDLVRHEQTLSTEMLSGYLKRLVVTRILRQEDANLTRCGFKSKRPPEAYRKCGIEEISDLLGLY